MNLATLQKLKLPDKSGVYFFMKGRQILYIGKATSLRGRTKSYFAKDLASSRGPLILDMAAKANKLKWQVTDSVLEALILEANLIKKHQPYYNTREKDDKSFNYIVITKEEVPKVMMVRGKNLNNKKNAFGPYTNSRQLKEALWIIRRIFPFLDEKNKNYIEFYKQINLAPDLKDKKMYYENIRNIKLFFSGKKRKLSKTSKKK